MNRNDELDELEEYDRLRYLDRLVKEAPIESISWLYKHYAESILIDNGIADTRQLIRYFEHELTKES